MDKLKSFLDFTIFTSEHYSVKVYNALIILLIFIFARLLLWVMEKYFRRKVREEKIDEGKKYAILQVVRYVVYIAAILISVDSIGINITVILAGSTALLVGLGLGLQDFFRDLVAGFIILSERSVTAGDIVELNGIIGKVVEVRLRTTSLLTRDDIVVIVPNSNLTTKEVVNWSQNMRTTRFSIKVGVAYGSDTELVNKLLIEAAKDHKEVLLSPKPYVMFSDFGNSALEFTLFFFSSNLFRIERIKSDIRFEIDRKFRENGITIPFPQRDVWLRNPNTEKQE